MKTTNKLKIINDPIYGFISIPSALIFDLIAHPYFQRLRRISQMGLSYLVYPGAHHTRFHHALGAMHLMQRAIQVLRFKQVAISKEEEQALWIAILLHDIGHGPFSHSMEHSIVEQVSHEDISLLFMEQLNIEFNGALSLAIRVFKGEYERPFLNQLVSSQLDMDRADYLKRDSFYTGVAEGNINSERLINMLYVVDDELVVEEKGIYSVEQFLVARRLMYWQVYLHKTSMVAEQLLIRVLKRAKEVSQKDPLFAGDAFSYFLQNKISKQNFNTKALAYFSALDDYDVMGAIKQWRYHKDSVLSTLCSMLLDRELLQIKVKKKPISAKKLEKLLEKTQQHFSWSKEEASYFVFSGRLVNQAYHSEKQNINIFTKTEKKIDITRATDQLHLKALAKPVTKYYICYPKQVSS